MADREVPEDFRADYYGGDVYAARQPACTPDLRTLHEATLDVISRMNK